MNRLTLIIHSFPASVNVLSHMRVESVHRDKVPKGLLIDSCNLKLNESVGQGT